MSLTKKVQEITLWKVALPSLVMILLSTAASPINTFIASGVNKTSVEAIGTAGSLMMIFGVLLSLLTGGSGIIIAQYIGRKVDDDKLKKATDSTFLVSIFQGLFIVIILMSLNKVLLKSWGLREGTQQFKDGSLYIYSLAPNFIVISVIGYFASVSSIYGYPKWSTASGMIQVFLDIIISYVLVNYTDLGIMGVITGTLVSNFVDLILLTILYSVKVQRFWKIRHFDWKTIKKLISISVPIAGEKINYNIGSFVRGVIIGVVAIKIGLETNGHNYMIWSRSIYLSIQAITLIGSVAMSIAVESVVARKLGNAEFKDAKHIVMKAYIYSLIIDIPLTLLVFFIQGPLIDILTSAEPNKEYVNILKDQLKWAFLLLIALETGRAANLVYIAATRSAGDAKFTSIVSVPVTWIFSILVSWLLAQYAELGWLGIVIGMTLDECVRGAINYWRWKSNKWVKHIDKIHDEKGEKLTEIDEKEAINSI